MFNKIKQKVRKKDMERIDEINFIIDNTEWYSEDIEYLNDLIKEKTLLIQEDKNDK
jgi:chromosomal replication initiation ATPase DnaA